MDISFRLGVPARQRAAEWMCFLPVEIFLRSILGPAQLRPHGIAERYWQNGCSNVTDRIMVSILARLPWLSGGHLTCGPVEMISLRRSGYGVVNRSGKSHPDEGSISAYYR